MQKPTALNVRWRSTFGKVSAGLEPREMKGLLQPKVCHAQQTNGMLTCQTLRADYTQPSHGNFAHSSSSRELSAGRVFLPERRIDFAPTAIGTAKYSKHTINQYWYSVGDSQLFAI